MILEKVTIKRRFVTGEYEFVEIEGTATPEGKESLEALARKLTVSMEEFIEGATQEPEQTKPAAKAATKGKKNANTKTDTTDDEESHDDSDEESNDGAASESSEDDEAADSEDSDDSDSESDDSEGDDSDDEEEKPVKKASGKKPAASKEKGSKKSFKKKPQSYNRTIEQHKEIFSGILKSINPKWNKSDVTKTKGKNASVKMDGKEFLDEDGEVLESFTAEVKKLMAVKK